MNEDTLVTSDAESDGHRVKRFKAEGPATSAIISGLQKSNQIYVDTQVDSPIEVGSSSSPQSFQKSLHTVLQDPSVQDMDMDGAAGPQTTNVDIDFSTAPSHPTKLAIWVAQQINLFKAQDRKRDLNSMESKTDHDRNSRSRSVSHVPGADGRRPDLENDEAKASEREKMREENRGRKKLWREQNPFKNSDNDLRCRINVRAKSLYGIGNSAEKIVFMETEFAKRVEKRRNKEKRGYEFPGFSISSEVGNALFSNPGDLVTLETNAAGTLLFNTLLSVRNHNNGHTNRESAAALKASLDDESVSRRPFIEALRILAGNSELINSIKTALKGYVPVHDDIDINSGANTANGDTSRNNKSPDLIMQSSTTQPVIPEYQTVDLTSQQNSHEVRVIHAMTKAINDMSEARSDTYITPYANPPKAALPNDLFTTNGVTTQNMNGIFDSTSSKPVGNSHGSDQSQIDSFLALANGGSLHDNGDDDAQDTTSQQVDSNGSPQRDIDISAVLQRIIDQHAAEYGFDSGEKQAKKLQALFAEAGISINTIIPAAQGYATSHLYAHLAIKARFSGGGINPAHASTYGNTIQMNQRVLSKPGAISQPARNTTTMWRTDGTPPYRAKSVEEMRKIRLYGYPPIPGRRPGRN